jgi:hypothetical protein
MKGRKPTTTAAKMESEFPAVNTPPLFGLVVVACGAALDTEVVN